MRAESSDPAPRRPILPADEDDERQAEGLDAGQRLPAAHQGPNPAGVRRSRGARRVPGRGGFGGDARRFDVRLGVARGGGQRNAVTSRTGTFVARITRIRIGTGREDLSVYQVPEIVRELVIGSVPDGVVDHLQILPLVRVDPSLDLVRRLVLPRDLGYVRVQREFVLRPGHVVHLDGVNLLFLHLEVGALRLELRLHVLQGLSLGLHVGEELARRALLRLDPRDALLMLGR
mmetsp:Transcript_1342/g.5987  ORF Transcript_1342/g.5987 Transcript_1342/m.5987 type:complete len:232 (+) Transcript_1342:6276-6971(+)